MSSDSLGLKRKLMTGCGSLHFIAFFDKEQADLQFTYLNKGSTGGCNNFMIGLSRMMSLAASKGATVEEISDQLQSCGACPSYAIRRATEGDTSRGACCPVAIGYALKDMQKQAKVMLGLSINADTPPESPSVSECLETLTNELCPECQGKMVVENGISRCIECGFQVTS